jgi:hypothetical protein
MRPERRFKGRNGKGRASRAAPRTQTQDPARHSLIAARDGLHNGVHRYPIRTHPVRVRIRSISCSKSCGESRLTSLLTACIYSSRAAAAFSQSGSLSSRMRRSIVGQFFGVQIVPLNPAVVVTVPGRSEIASSFPCSECFDQVRSQTSQKFPFVELSSSRFTVAPSWAVHHHI